MSRWLLVGLAVLSGLSGVFASSDALSAQAHSDKVRPDDQALAQRLSLRLSDLPSELRYTAKEPASSRPRTTGCASEPKVLRALTGFRDSPLLAPAYEWGTDSDWVTLKNTVRVFSSEPVAARWFGWATHRDGFPLCHQKALRRSMEKRFAWTGSSPTVSTRRFPQSFKPQCGADCHLMPTFTVKAWQVRAEVESCRGSACSQRLDLVLIQVEQVVLAFAFISDGDWFRMGAWGVFSPDMVGGVLDRFPEKMK